MKKHFVISTTLAIITLFVAVSTVQAAVLDVISQPLHGNSGSCPTGQSFTATATGVVTTIRVAQYFSGNVGLLTIYAGEGDTGMLLHSQWVTYTGSGGSFHTIILTTPVPVTMGQKYTFYPTPRNVLPYSCFYDIDTNPYPGGTEMLGNDTRPSRDLKFEVVIEDGLVPPPGSTDDKAPDDRINWKHGDGYAVLYAQKDDKGNPTLHLYCIDAKGNGYLGEILTQEMFDKAPAKPPVNTKVGETSACRVPIKFYVLTSGEYQVNIGPNYEGKVDVVVFTGLPPAKIHYYRLK